MVAPATHPLGTISKLLDLSERRIQQLSREGRRIIAIKGVGGEGKALVGRPSRNNIGKIKLFPFGTDTAKELIYGRLKIEDPGAGYCNFPVDRDDEYYRQLVGE